MLVSRLLRSLQGAEGSGSLLAEVKYLSEKSTYGVQCRSVASEHLMSDDRKHRAKEFTYKEGRIA